MASMALLPSRSQNSDQGRRMYEGPVMKSDKGKDDVL